MHVTPANQVTAGPQELVLLLARRGTAVTDCGRRPLAYAPPASGSEFAPSGALVGCARSERPSRSRLRSDEARVPDDRDPFEASVRRGWREPSKRSSASVGADAPFRGIGVAERRPGGRLLCRHCDRAVRSAPRAKAIAGRPVIRRLRGVAASVRLRQPPKLLWTAVCQGLSTGCPRRGGHRCRLEGRQA